MSKIQPELCRLITNAGKQHNIDLFSEYQYSRVIMETEYFLDVFRARYESNVLMGINIDGFKELIEASSMFQKNEIVSHSFENEKSNFTVYTDINASHLLGIVNFNSVEFKNGIPPRWW